MNNSFKCLSVRVNNIIKKGTSFLQPVGETQNGKDSERKRDKMEACSFVTDSVGLRRPCECRQHDLLRNTKRRAHRGTLCSQSISISQ